MDSRLPLAEVRSVRYLAVIVLVVSSGLLALGMLRAPSHQRSISSVYKLGYLVGPTTESLVEHRGLLICTELMGTPGDPICFKAARMPIASTVLALGVECFGDRIGKVAIFKTVLCLIPLWFCMFWVLRAMQSRMEVLVCAGLLLLPMLIVNYLVVVTSMEVEEGYFFGLISLAVALVLFPSEGGIAWGLGTGLLLALIYLSKSSMLLAVVVLLIALLTRIPSWKLRVAVVALVALAPLSWAVHQHEASGRFSLGTSLDGMNLHKGNNDQFQNRYPSPNSYLDSFDWQLNQGHFFTNEWDYNEFHMAAARQFALNHKAYTVRSLGRKIDLMLFSLKRYNVTKMSRAAGWISDCGMLLFRLLLWSSVLLAGYGAVTGGGVGRFGGLTYLCFVAAYCLPYFVGFGYTRHAVVLVYPAAVLCCLAVRTKDKRASQAQGVRLTEHRVGASAI